MLRGVLVGGVVAAASRSTFLTHSEVDPLCADLHAFFAFPSLGMLYGFDRFDISAAAGAGTQFCRVAGHRIMDGFRLGPSGGGVIEIQPARGHTGQSSLNPNDLALAAAKVAQAQQRVATLDAQLGYATIRSPITGIVTDQFQYEGEFAAAGGKLVTIADVSQVIVKAPFADTVAAQLKVGDPTTVLPTDTSGEEMKGQITLLSHSSDATNRTVEVWVALGNGAGRLRANGSAQITVFANSKTDAVVVPASSVTLEASNGNEGTVMVVDAKSVAHEQKVAVGVRTPDKVEITSGLQGGETVVIEGNYGLPDGTKVEVSEAKKDESGSQAEEKREEKREVRGFEWRPWREKLW